MTDQQYQKLGKSCRDAVDGNWLIGSFAAKLVGESYPFSKAMAAIVFKNYSDLDLGKKFVKWINKEKL